MKKINKIKHHGTVLDNDFVQNLPCFSLDNEYDELK